MQELQQKLRAYIVDNYLFAQANGFSNTDSFLEQGILDSTGVLELISYLEEEYGICIESEEIVPDNLDSIERLSRFVAGKCAQRNVTATSTN